MGLSRAAAAAATSGLDWNRGNFNSLLYNIGLRILVYTHTLFFGPRPTPRAWSPQAPVRSISGHLVGAILQVVTPPPAASSGHFGLPLLLLHPVGVCWRIGD